MSKALKNDQKFAQIDVLNLAVPFDGIITAGQPSPEQLEEFKAAGVATVVNLRHPSETLGFDEQLKVEALGMTYLALPIAGSAGLSKENVLKFRNVLEESDRPVLIHCGSSNRVGALFALEAHLDGETSLEDALEIGRAAGLSSLEPVTRQLLNQQ